MPFNDSLRPWTIHEYTNDYKWMKLKRHLVSVLRHSGFRRGIGLFDLARHRWLERGWSSEAPQNPCRTAWRLVSVCHVPRHTRPPSSVVIERNPSIQSFVAVSAHRLLHPTPPEPSLYSSPHPLHPKTTTGVFSGPSSRSHRSSKMPLASSSLPVSPSRDTSQAMSATPRGHIQTSPSRSGARPKHRKTHKTTLRYVEYDKCFSTGLRPHGNSRGGRSKRSKSM